MTSNKIGKIHSFETFGTVDGPGIRFVVFLQGCEFRCIYCHNPDTFCMEDATIFLTAEEVFEEVKKYRTFYRNGGITISGGEPLLQAEFLENLLDICQREGFHTAIDTSGSVLTERIKRVLEKTNLVLLDIKSIDPEQHVQITGKPLQPTLDFAKYLSEKNIPTWIRYVIVPGLTDKKELVEKHAEYVASLGNVEKVEILPFHKLGEHKYEELGIDFPLSNVRKPREDEIKIIKQIYIKQGLNVN